MVDGIKKSGETRQITYDVERFRLTAEGAPVLLIGHMPGMKPLPMRTVLALQRFYDEYRSLPVTARPKALEGYINRWFMLPTDPLDDITRLREAFRSISPETAAFLRREFGDSVEHLLGRGTTELQVEIAVPNGAMVDGDSLGLATAIASISSLSDVSVKRGIGITGAINNYGDVLAVESVNAKIIGWFQVCQANGLNGEQGVIIPKANENDLDLTEEIVEAVKPNLFHVYAVEKVDQAIEIMTGLPANQVHEMVQATTWADRGIKKRAMVRLFPFSESVGTVETGTNVDNH